MTVNSYVRTHSGQPRTVSSLSRLAVGGMLASVAFVLAGCSAAPVASEHNSSPSAASGKGTASEPDGATGQLESVNIGYFPLVHTSTIVNALERGFLEDNGIEAELVQTQGGAQAIPALVSGEVDITYANYTSALLAAHGDCRLCSSPVMMWARTITVSMWILTPVLRRSPIFKAKALPSITWRISGP